MRQHFAVRDFNNPDIENHIFRSVENVCLDTVIGWKHHGQTHHFLYTYGEE